MDVLKINDDDDDDDDHAWRKFPWDSFQEEWPCNDACLCACRDSPTRVSNLELLKLVSFTFGSYSVSIQSLRIIRAISFSLGRDTSVRRRCYR